MDQMSTGHLLCLDDVLTYRHHSRECTQLFKICEDLLLKLLQMSCHQLLLAANSEGSFSPAMISFAFTTQSSM